MKQKIEEKLKSIELRKKGYSVNEIVEKVGVAKSSVSVWVRNVKLTEKARNRLFTKIKLAQIISAENKRQQTQNKMNEHFHTALREISQKKFTKIDKKIICALLYWCEGAKNKYSGVYFANSDPNLVKAFLDLFRDSFNLDEKKFRACIHLHEYHNPARQLSFWSKVTKIPKNQFIKPYLKPHTGKRIRDGYPGCIGIKYHHTDTARKLLAIAQAFFNKGV